MTDEAIEPETPAPTERQPRCLTDHKTNFANEQLAIEVLDDPSPIGSQHCYRIAGFDITSNPAARPEALALSTEVSLIFQQGDPAVVGVNGVTNEALLSILIDRMRCFQVGQLAGRENNLALQHLEEALHWLAARTRQRRARNVEGSQQP